MPEALPRCRFEQLAAQIAYPGLTFAICQEGRHTFLRVGCPDGRCTQTGDPMSWWGRKWRLSPHMTDGEVVATAFKALLTALEHEARELFTFSGAAIFDSHVDVYHLVALRQRADAIVGRD